jgi:DNA helicase-2/ATP-dependent DNA helicase PcrA
MEEGLFPSAQSFQDPTRLEEERRLAYVGITRAMKKLYITHAECRRIYGSEQRHPASRFLKEIPISLTESIRPQLKVKHPFGNDSTGVKSANSFGNRFNTNVAKPRETEAGLSLGQTVKHAKFGEGVILDADGQGNRARVQVNFQHAGTKWLLIEMANLEPM